MPLPAEIAGLVERFARNREAYRSAAYNEAQARQEFIDPFFKALGWDMDNTAGLAEAYKDVIHEDAIKVGGATKAPDYCFRIGGTRKFFIEAKKPAVGVESDPEPAYQLRRYAWTSKLPLSILTDFEEFAVYDCRIRPAQSDKASAARVFYCTFDQFADEWDWIAGLFSKDAVLKGAFDKYAESNKRKKGTAEVDAEFLKEIEGWREALAQNFALRNPQLSVRDLNFAVQRTIDRVIFLRMCEDRGIEIYGGLQALLNGDRVYERLAVLFRQADDKYNSGLFYFTRAPGREPPDELTLALKLDDKVLKDILRGLYYPDSPYEFSVLPPEILGQVYEQFLGKVIRLTAGHRAKVEEKPEVRKAGGVYYTPTYIVDYIVKHTVGKLLEERVPGLGARGSGLRAGDLGDAPHGDQTLPRPGGVAKGDGSRGTGLPDREDPAGGGTLRADQPDSTGGGVDTRERGGGARPDAPGRLPPSSLDSARLAGGTGDAPDLGGPARPAGPGGGPPDLGAVPARRPAPERAHRRAAKKGARVPSRQPLAPIGGPLRILDPACGSGSFLLGAYQYLLNWHRDWYVAGLGVRGSGSGSRIPSPEPRVPGPDFRNRLYQGPGGQWCLTIQEKKRILLNHIYGVDIDPQAVETTKLALLLKVLEGETAETIGSTLRLFHERALPDLDRNIKCGNSLIGPDFYDHQQMSLFDEDERLRINAFDWQAEFPDVFVASGLRTGRLDPSRARKEAVSRSAESERSVSARHSREPLPDGRGSDRADEPDSGFDAVIGNPPYIFTREQISLEQRAYFARRFRAVWEKHNTFMLFMELMLRLLRRDGRGSFIVPNSWLSIESGKLLRLAMVERVELVADLNYAVFQGVSMEPCIFIVGGEGCCVPVRVIRASTSEQFCAALPRDVPRDHWKHGDGRFVFGDTSRASELVQGLAARASTVGALYDVRSGLQAYERGKGTPPQTARDVADHVFDRARREDENSFRYLDGRDVCRYHLTWGGLWMQYGAWLAQPRELDIFRRPRVLLREITAPSPHCLHAAYVEEAYLNNKSVLNVLHAANERRELLILAAVLNSRLLSLYYKAKAVKSARKIFPKVVIKNLREFPFPVTTSTPVGDRLVTLVQHMLGLHKSLAAAKTAHEKTALQRQIDATDRQIDQLVYELYGLTDDEIRIVEGAPPSKDAHDV